MNQDHTETLPKICFEVSPLLFGMLLLLMGVGLQGTLLGVRAEIEGFPLLVTGMIMAAYYVGFLIGAKFVPDLIGRVGHVRTFASLGAVASAAMLLYGIYLSPLAWIVIRVIVGFCFSGLFVVAESWLNHRAPNQLRGQLLSVYIVVHLVGLMIGQYLLTLSDPEEITLFILISVMVSIAVVPSTLSSAPAPAIADVQKMPLIEMIKISPLGSYSVLINGLVGGVVFGMGAVFVLGIGYSTTEVSSFIAAYVFGGALLQWPLGWLSDRINRRGMLIVLTSCSVMAATALAFGGQSAGVAFLLVSAFLVGGTAMPIYSLSVSIINDRLELHQMVGASGTVVFLYGLGAAMGPFAASLVMRVFGAGGLFYGVAVILSSVLLVAFWRVSVSSGLDIEDQRNYTHLAPRGSGVALATTMDELVEEEEKAAD